MGQKKNNKKRKAAGKAENSEEFLTAVNVDDDFELVVPTVAVQNLLPMPQDSVALPVAAVLDPSLSVHTCFVCAGNRVDDDACRRGTGTDGELICWVCEFYTVLNALNAHYICSSCSAAVGSSGKLQVLNELAAGKGSSFSFSASMGAPGSQPPLGGEPMYYVQQHSICFGSPTGAWFAGRTEDAAGVPDPMAAAAAHCGAGKSPVDESMGKDIRPLKGIPAPHGLCAYHRGGLKGCLGCCCESGGATHSLLGCGSLMPIAGANVVRTGDGTMAMPVSTATASLASTDMSMSLEPGFERWWAKFAPYVTKIYSEVTVHTAATFLMPFDEATTLCNRLCFDDSVVLFARVLTCATTHVVAVRERLVAQLAKLGTSAQAAATFVEALTDAYRALEATTEILTGVCFALYYYYMYKLDLSFAVMNWGLFHDEIYMHPQIQSGLKRVRPRLRRDPALAVLQDLDALMGEEHANWESVRVAMRGWRPEVTAPETKPANGKKAITNGSGKAAEPALSMIPGMPVPLDISAPSRCAEMRKILGEFSALESASAPGGKKDAAAEAAVTGLCQRYASHVSTCERCAVPGEADRALLVHTCKKKDQAPAVAGGKGEEMRYGYGICSFCGHLHFMPIDVLMALSHIIDFQDEGKAKAQVPNGPAGPAPPDGRSIDELLSFIDGTDEKAGKGAGKAARKAKRKKEATEKTQTVSPATTVTMWSPPSDTVSAQNEDIETTDLDEANFMAFPKCPSSAAKAGAAASLPTLNSSSVLLGSKRPRAPSEGSQDSSPRTQLAPSDGSTDGDEVEGEAVEDDDDEDDEVAAFRRRLEATQPSATPVKKLPFTFKVELLNCMAQA